MKKVLIVMAIIAIVPILTIALIHGCEGDNAVKPKSDNFTNVIYINESELVLAWANNIVVDVSRKPADPGPLHASYIRCDGSLQVRCDSILTIRPLMKPLPDDMVYAQVPDFNWDLGIIVGDPVEFKAGDIWANLIVPGSTKIIDVNGDKAELLYAVSDILTLKVFGANTDDLELALSYGWEKVPS